MAGVILEDMIVKIPEENDHVSLINELSLINEFLKNDSCEVNQYGIKLVLALYKTADYFLPGAELAGTELIENLKVLAYNLDAAEFVINDDRFWVAFRASIALLELDMQLMKNRPERIGDLMYGQLIAKLADGMEGYILAKTDDLKYRRLAANLIDGMHYDSDQIELVEPYLRHAWTISDKLN